MDEHFETGRIMSSALFAKVSDRSVLCREFTVVKLAAGNEIAKLYSVMTLLAMNIQKKTTTMNS